jgi:hypothetical protein
MWYRGCGSGVGAQPGSVPVQCRVGRTSCRRDGESDKCGKDIAPIDVAEGCTIFRDRGGRNSNRDIGRLRSSRYPRLPRACDASIQGYTGLVKGTHVIQRDMQTSRTAYNRPIALWRTAVCDTCSWSTLYPTPQESVGLYSTLETVISQRDDSGICFMARGAGRQLYFPVVYSMFGGAQCLGCRRRLATARARVLLRSD